MTEPRSTDAPRATRAHPPETTEGWYAFHQILSFDRPALRHPARAGLDRQADTLGRPAEPVDDPDELVEL